MTQPPYVPLVPVHEGLRDDDRGQDRGEIVGADDARADAARSGADVDLSGAHRDSDDTPVGSADAEADAERTAGDQRAAGD